MPIGALGALALLGVVGGLESIATLFASPEQAPRLVADAGALRAGAARLLGIVALSGGVWWAIGTGKLGRYAAVAALGAVVILDLWSIDRKFFDFKPPASELFADDGLISRLRDQPKPFRVLDAGVYPGAVLMASRMQTVLGYHGVEVRFYDELLGGKNEWRNLGNPNLHDLLAVRFLLLPDSQAVAGFHPVTGPTPTTPRGQRHSL